jgi:arsenite-transporting ATPase
VSGDATRIVLVTGKGGVGKTTTAASLAVEAARAGSAVLVVSTDPAHSLGDVLGVDLPSAPSWRAVQEVVLDPAPAAQTGRLAALAVDRHTDVEASWGAVRDHLLGLLEGLDIDPFLADELVTLPGADEVAALLALALSADSGQWDLVVVDCAPTAETLRLLTLPEILGWHLDRLLPGQRRLLTALRPAASAATGLALPGPDVLAVVSTWRRLMARCRELLTGPHASVRIVLTPERVVIAEARRLRSAFALHGYAVDEVVVNRILPPGGDDWTAAWNRSQREGLRLIEESFDGIPVTASPHVAGEPIGTRALADLAARRWVLAGTPAALDDPVSAPAVEVAPDGADFVLRAPIGLADAEHVRVQRRGDDLVVGVSGERRILSLPSALRRCIVDNASVGTGVLTVRFVRDEEVWPRER